MTDNILDLEKLIDHSERTGWFEYKRGIEFELRYLVSGDLNQLVKESTIQKFDPKLKARTPSIDTNLLLPKIVGRCVIGWKGVTADSLSYLLPIDLSKLTEEKRKQMIPFDTDQMVALMRNCQDLDNFVTSVCTNIENFRDEGLEDELKNSDSSQSGS